MFIKHHGIIENALRTFYWSILSRAPKGVWLELTHVSNYFKQEPAAQNNITSFASLKNVMVMGKSRIIYNIPQRKAITDIANNDQTKSLFSEYLFHDELFNIVDYEPKNNRVFLRRRDLKAMAHLEGEWISLLHHGSENWMHWLSESIPKLATLDFTTNNVGIIVDSNLPESMYQTIKRICISNKVVRVDRHKFYYVDCLIIPHTTGYSLFWERNASGKPGSWEFNNSALHYIRSKLVGSVCKGKHTRIYMQRKSLFRHLKDEATLQTLLEDMGFISINPSRITLDQQIEHLSNSEIVVSQAGAALANIAFMPAGSIVIVIALDSEYVHYKYFEDYAKIFGVNLVYYKCKSASPKKLSPNNAFTVKHPVNHDLVCDYQDFKYFLMPYLANHQTHGS